MLNVECGMRSVIIYHEGVCIGGEHDEETSVWQRESCGRERRESSGDANMLSFLFSSSVFEMDSARRGEKEARSWMILLHFHVLFLLQLLNMFNDIIK